MRLKFTEQDVADANAAWGCNCGPAALAACTNRTLDEIRPIVEAVGFAERGFMNVSMMMQCCGELLLAKHQTPKISKQNLVPLLLPTHGLVRIQRGGPWIINGNPARWAATATHWIAVSKQVIVFDVNCGLLLYSQWLSEIVPAITGSIKRADGSWWPTHSWEIAQ